MLDTTIASSVLIAVLILLRYLLKGKINPRLQYALWLLVAVRLLMPFSVSESPFSVLNVVDTGWQARRIESPALSAQPGSPPKTGESVAEGTTGGNDGESITVLTGATGNPRYISEDVTGEPASGPSEQDRLGDILHMAWLIGAAGVGFWFILQNISFYARLRKTRQAVEISGSRLPVYLSRYVNSPCLFGFRPAIYVHPDSLTDDVALKYILSHEETHWRHGDHLWSYLRCICLTLYWFNPLVWWAAILSRRDCEIACDESTLNRLGDEHRRAYGNTLISMIGCRARPSELLSATTMTSGKAGIKERIAMIARKPKMLISTLVTVVLAMVVVVGCTFTGANGNSDKDVTLHERGGVTVAIPNEYVDQLLIDPVEPDDETILMRVYQKSTYEKYEGMGLLFSVARYTEAQYEQFLSSDGSGQTFFAKEDSKDDEEGQHYYGFFFPTDVQAPDDYETYKILFSAVGDFVKSDFVQRNKLTAYSDDEFFGRTYTYEGEHVFIKYYPYYAENGSKDEVWTLFLSQPAKQGGAGIWCVERWRDQYGNVYPYFPDENGMPSREYYAALQIEADAGRQASLLDPAQVVIAFVERAFGHIPNNPGSFELAENSGIPAELYAESTGNIHDYVPKLIAGEVVSAYDLLPCLENFTIRTWGELTAAYGSDWWDPLWSALRNAAISEMRADASDQIARNYYIGKAYLAADGAYTEMVSDIVLRQWTDNSQLYVAAMNEGFSADEAARLRSHLTYLSTHRGGAFSLGISRTDPELSLSLNIFPVDFPFGIDLAEISRESRRVESFGNVTIIESDGLQVTYFNNYEGVYFVSCLRANKEGYFSTGVAIGDPEEKLWDHWLSRQLRKLDSISYDDEAWFGDDYDYAYVHTPADSTKSIVYLIKDSRVSGIELVNGLDGPMYP